MFPGLIQNIDIFKNNKDLILDKWVENEIVSSVLKKHKIDKIFYKNMFASSVFNYLISVIDEKHKAGECPVIEVMLLLFKKRNIPLSDVFLICINFKNSMMAFALNENLLDTRLLYELSEVMDKNFKGVIDSYVFMYYTLNQSSSKKEKATKR